MSLLTITSSYHLQPFFRGPSDLAQHQPSILWNSKGALRKQPQFYCLMFHFYHILDLHSSSFSLRFSLSPTLKRLSLNAFYLTFLLWLFLHYPLSLRTVPPTQKTTWFHVYIKQQQALVCYWVNTGILTPSSHYKRSDWKIKQGIEVLEIKKKKKVLAFLDCCINDSCKNFISDAQE